MLSISLVLDEAARGVHEEDHQKLLNGVGNILGEVDMIGQVGGRVGASVNKIHPPEFEAVHELKWGFD